MTAEQLKKDTQNRLETIFHVRTRLDDLAEHKRQCIIASLLHAYDTSWQVESFPSLIGKSNSGNNEEKTSAQSSSNPKKDVASLKRWMIVMGVGYLTQGSNIGDSKKFVQLCTVLMDKVEQRHGSKLKPIIRQIIGKQGRLTVKNVAESQRQNQNLPLDSSTASSNPDSEKNPFLGRSLPRSALEAPPAPGRDLPRTPLKKTDDNAQDFKETDPEIEQFKLPAKPKSQEVENSKPESYLTVPQKNTIPSGKDLARTPMAADKKKHNPISETCEYEVPTNFGADYSPRTPEIVSQRKVLPEDEPIVSKIATLIQKTEEESKKEQVLENMIPCGSKIIPRTPFHGGAALDKEETTEPQKSTQNSSQENKIKANFIPCGLNIPRTPFNGKDMTKSLEDAELQTDKTSTEVDIEVIAKEDEPTRKVPKVAKNLEYVKKTEEEPKKVEKQPSEKPSIKSSKAKKTAVRPRSKKNDEENVESNRETHDEKSAKIMVTEIQDKAEDTKTSKKKDEKIKNNKTVELLSKSEEEMPKRRRSPRLIPTSNGANSVAIEETIVPLTTNVKTSSVAPSSQAMTEENKSSTTRQRLQRPTKAKDAEKDVKLPQIEDKSSTTTGKPAAATKRKGKKKASKAKMDVTFDVIEELVPPLKMARGKDGGLPSERISDELYSTPVVKKVGIAPKQRKKTKKLTAQIFSIEDEIFQTPRRKQK